MVKKMQSKALRNCVGVLLAGGQSRRFGGGDKCLQSLHGKTLLQRVAERAQPQVDTLLLNASGDASRFAAYDLEIVEDVIDGHLGPLVGVLSALEWAKVNQPTAEWVASFATDAPFFPPNMVRRLLEAATDNATKIAVATSYDRAQPIFAVWSVDLAQDLRRAVAEEGMRKVMAWAQCHNPAFVEFDAHGLDPFYNINTPDDLDEAERLMSEGDFDAKT